MDEKKAISAPDPDTGEISNAPASGSESVSIREETSGIDDTVQPTVEPGSGLPFSKARCIALVATVTGASFLNVSIDTKIERYEDVLLTTTDSVRPGRGDHITHHRQGFQHPRHSCSVDSVLLHTHIRLLPPVVGPDWRYLRQAEGVHPGITLVFCHNGDKPISAQ